MGSRSQLLRTPQGLIQSVFCRLVRPLVQKFETSGWPRISVDTPKCNLTAPLWRAASCAHVDTGWLSTLAEVLDNAKHFLQCNLKRSRNPRRSQPSFRRARGTKVIPGTQPMDVPFSSSTVPYEVLIVTKFSLRSPHACIVPISVAR
jgi:hypothetical protein